MKRNSIKTIAVIGMFTMLTAWSIDKIANAAEKKAKAKSKKITINPDDPNSPIFLGENGIMRTTGNPKVSGFAAEAFKIGAGFHSQAMDLDQLPKDKFGLINWVKIVDQGIIKPQADLDPDFVDMEPMVLDILFEMKGGFTDNVIFPHRQHTYWLDCTNCHDEIFIPMAGANKVTMPEIAQGQWCGRCHGRVAFPISDCTRCHKYPKGHEIENADTTSRRTLQ